VDTKNSRTIRAEINDEPDGTSIAVCIAPDVWLDAHVYRDAMQKLAARVQQILASKPDAEAMRKAMAEDVIPAWLADLEAVGALVPDDFQGQKKKLFHCDEDNACGHLRAPTFLKEVASSSLLFDTGIHPAVEDALAEALRLGVRLRQHLVVVVVGEEVRVTSEDPEAPNPAGHFVGRWLVTAEVPS
jgi:hypothetical protein